MPAHKFIQTCQGKSPQEEVVQSGAQHVRKYYWLLSDKLPEREMNDATSYGNGTWYGEGQGSQVETPSVTVSLAPVPAESKGHQDKMRPAAHVNQLR